MLTRRTFVMGSGQAIAAWSTTRLAPGQASDTSKSTIARIRDAEPLDHIEVIDSHAHFQGLWQGRKRPPNLDFLLRQMDKCGIDISIFSHSGGISASTAEQYRLAHEAAATAVQAHPDRLRAYVVFHPHLLDESLRWAEKTLDPNSPFLGFKLHGVSHDYPIFGPSYRRAFEFANRHELPVLFHIVSSHGATPPLPEGCSVTEAIDRVMQEFPRMKLIWAHFCRGVDDWAEFTHKHPNVTTDTASSLVPYRTLERTVARAGAGRILFGSDSTYLSPGAQLAVVGFAEISDADKEKIFARNARWVFGNHLPERKPAKAA